ncbi:MAG: hypothetical protein IPG71_04500 [bacterium]|nr:hypothetical protein [bacterium]
MTGRFRRVVTTPIVVILLTCLSPLHAAELEAKVTYVAWKTLYLNAGRAHGIESGLNGLLYRNTSLIGEISIAATADSTCVATLSGDSVIALVGDRAVILLSDHTVERLDGSESNKSDQVGPSEHPGSQAATRKLPQFIGRLAVQFDAYDDRADKEIAELLPGFSTRVVIRRIAGEGTELGLRYRGRRLSGGADEMWQHRLYTAALNFLPAHERWKASLGRIQAGSVAGIGYIDGGYGEVAVGRSLAMGLFGGAQAELDMSRTDLSTSKAGALVTYRNEKNPSKRTSATVALAGEYLEDISVESSFTSNSPTPRAADSRFMNRRT